MYICTETLCLDFFHVKMTTHLNLSAHDKKSRQEKNLLEYDLFVCFLIKAV